MCVFVHVCVTVSLQLEFVNDACGCVMCDQLADLHAGLSQVGT